MSCITLVEYDPFLPSLFEERALSITALPSPFVREVHEIGSTAIPGLAAKPKIDIDAVMVALGAPPELSARLRDAGFTFHGAPHASDLWTFTTATTLPYGTRLYSAVTTTPPMRITCSSGTAAGKAGLCRAI
ncbi:GrpB family protein [Ensifer adhaerens]|uniref:GrpB family protein n=1 Tax=Ensifer adhaerens TaxID=106592 RepID=UPI001CBCF885|nr:GrpB family protein [Ensifer adhaerens]MBZ7921235.1 GrpB family protein [Ensifer adhaerens]UAX93670.1 GrpB family protein [Ensifer adhaerens]UAY01306.1 GrpB family protein [Ensifer adhaerens]UAY08688.1 GrpB family protein [Ensifer adhaerens]